MTDASDLPVVKHPEWLTTAIEEYQTSRSRAQKQLESIAQDRAQIINDRLKALGIVPLKPATTLGRRVVPAQLVEIGWDDGQETWGVEADWDPSTDLVMLVARGHDSTVYGSVGHLDSVKDVVAAMYNGPAQRDPVTPQASFYSIATRSIRAGVSSSTSEDSDQIAVAIQGLTAAVLYLADLVAEKR